MCAALRWKWCGKNSARRGSSGRVRFCDCCGRANPLEYKPLTDIKNPVKPRSNGAFLLLIFFHKTTFHIFQTFVFLRPYSKVFGLIYDLKNRKHAFFDLFFRLTVRSVSLADNLKNQLSVRLASKISLLIRLCKRYLFDQKNTPLVGKVCPVTAARFTRLLFKMRSYSLHGFMGLPPIAF